MAKRSSKSKSGPSTADRRVPDDAPTAQDPRLRRGCDIAAGLIAGVMFLIVLGLSTTHVIWPDDQYSDMNILMSGETFATHGLLKLKLLPVFYIGAMTDPPSYYTHYPSLPAVIDGLWQMMGIRGVPAIRVLCGLLCIAGLICMYLAFSPDIGALPAACGLGFVATTGYFFTYCISVHQHTYNIFFIGIFLLLFTRAVRSDRPDTRVWIGCWIALMLESLTSFEFIIYPQVFAWVYVLATGRIRRQWRLLIVLATAPIAGVGLHYLQNCWALGWSAAWADALDAFRRPGRGPAQDRWFILQKVPEFVRLHSQRLYFWSWPVLPVVAAAWLALSGRQRAGQAWLRRAGALLVGTVVASVSWYFFMPIHTVKHPHTMSQLLPLVMLVMGAGAATIGRWLLNRDTPVHERILAVLAGVVLVFGQTQSIGECFNRASNQRPESFYLFEAMGENAFPPKSAVLTNTYADAQLAYFIRRPLWRSPTPLLPFDRESITSLQERLPDDWRVSHYVFDTRGDHKAFQILASNCPGQLVTIPGRRRPHALIIFDISSLFGPPGKPPALEPEVKRVQLQGKFPTWKSPGFMERLRDVLALHGKL